MVGTAFPPERALDAALAAGVITKDDAALVREAESARRDAVQVDSFADLGTKRMEGMRATRWRR